MDFKKYRKLFLEEARVHLAGLDAEIVRLEQDAGAELVDSIFRRAHSLKGMAASMGYQPIVEVAHELEALMTRVRDRSVKLSAGVVSTLLAGRDQLAVLVDRVDAGESLDAPAAPAALIQAADAAPVELPAEGIWLEIRISAQAVLPGARAFQVTRLLAAIAETFLPSVEEIRAGLFQNVLRAKLTHPATDELLTQIRTLPDVASVNSGMAVPSAAAAVTPGVTAVKSKMEAVSHIRIDTAVLDRFVDMVGELVTVNNQIRETSRSLFSEDLMSSVTALGRITGDLYQEVLQARMVPFSMLTDRLPRSVRDLALQLGKEVRLTISGGDVELDRSVMENLSDPLLHLVRNAIDHGLETAAVRRAAGKNPVGELHISARQAEGLVVVQISDDGGGIDPARVTARAVERGLIKAGAAGGLARDQIFDLLFRPGFSTAEKVSDVSGRGVGLDVVKTAVEALGGEIQIQSEPGAGTTFQLRLQARVAIIPVFLVRAGEQTFALPIAKVARARWLRRDEVKFGGGRASMIIDGQIIPFNNLANLLGILESFDETEELVVFEFERGSLRMLIGIDGFLEERDVYLKTAPQPLDRLRGLLGITLVRGEPIFVIDPGMMVWTHV